MSSRHRRSKSFVSATVLASAQTVKPSCFRSAIASLVTEGSMAGGQTTTSDGPYQTRGHSVPMEAPCCRIRRLRAQHPSTDLPVSGASVARATKTGADGTLPTALKPTTWTEDTRAEWTPHGIYQPRTAIAHG